MIMGVRRRRKEAHLSPSICHFVEHLVKILTFAPPKTIAGWNDFVADKHDLARDAFKEWVVHGKPKNNFIFENMKKTRAVFKLALRYCKNHIEQIKADKCAEDLYNGDSRKFFEQCT